MHGFFASLRMTASRQPVILSEAKDLRVTITERLSFGV